MEELDNFLHVIYFSNFNLKLLLFGLRFKYIFEMDLISNFFENQGSFANTTKFENIYYFFKKSFWIKSFNLSVHVVKTMKNKWIFYEFDNSIDLKILLFQIPGMLEENWWCRSLQVVLAISKYSRMYYSFEISA